MDTSHHVREIIDNGFTLIESLLSDADITKIKEALAPWLQGRHMGRNDFEGFKTERVYALLAKDRVFAKIVEHPQVLPILDGMLHSDYLLSSILAINCHPGETVQNFHRDNIGGVGADTTKIHGISTIWNFDEFTDNNGATEIIPGSHLWTDEFPRENDSRSVKVIVPKGSVIIFSGSLFHRGGANNSEQMRLAITPQYCQPWLRQLETMVLAVPPDKASMHSERIQQLLGYSVNAPGFMGHVDGLHPRRLIDSSYKGRRDRGFAS